MTICSAFKQGGGLAQRVRARRGPMTGSGVIRRCVSNEMADYANANPPEVTARRGDAAQITA